MPISPENDFDPSQFPLMLDQIAAAITLIDLDGRMLYYNAYSAQILDRKPEYLGKDVRLCHEKQESNDRIDRMLEAFKAGRREAFYYEADRYGKRIAVTLTPFEVDGQLTAFIQTVTVKT
jgi:PAS domain S-box-containing protein